MQNPYPESLAYGAVVGGKVKNLSYYNWQEGYDAKEKEAQGLYEALKMLTKRVHDMRTKGYLKVSPGSPLYLAEKALKKWEDK